MYNQILKDLFSKKRLGTATKRQLTQELVHEYGEPVSRPCKLITIPRSHFYYESKNDDIDVIDYSSMEVLAIEVDTSLLLEE